VAFPQLTGHTPHTSAPNSGSVVGLSVLALAAVFAVGAWRFVPLQSSAAPSPPAVVATAGPTTPPPGPRLGPSDDQQLHLAHAEQELVAAAEQLHTARRLLAALSLDLNRSYLQYEKRRTDTAWTACDGAQRAIEAAREHLKVIASIEKDN
jgi:hypothetical protein